MRARRHIVVVTPVFPPEPVVSSRTSADIADALAGEGHAVTVVTAFPNRPAGRIYPGFSRRPFQRECRGSGVKVIRCFAFFSRRSTLVSRFMENLSFGITSALALLFLPRPDVVYSVTWPIIATALLTIVSRLRRIPVVTSVQDMYPESMIAQGRITADGVTSRWLKATDRLCISASRAVIVLSEYARRSYIRDRGLSADRVVTIPNWMKSQAVVLDEDAGHAFRRGLQVPGAGVLAVFGGNIGAAAGVETLIEAVERVNDPRLFLLIAGDGSSLSACQALAGRIAGARVRFHAPWPEAETSMVLSSADLLLLPTRGYQSLASTPSKLLAYMLTGKPVLATAVPESDLACIIEEAGCGWVVAPDNPELLAGKLREALALSTKDRYECGQSGRRYAQQRLTAEACVPRVLELLNRCAQTSVAQN